MPPSPLRKSPSKRLRPEASFVDSLLKTLSPREQDDAVFQRRARCYITSLFGCLVALERGSNRTAGHVDIARFAQLDQVVDLAFDARLAAHPAAEQLLSYLRSLPDWRDGGGMPAAGIPSRPGIGPDTRRMHFFDHQYLVRAMADLAARGAEITNTLQ